MTGTAHAFLPPGSAVTAEPGKVYVDVGNHFGPGVLDHHHADSPSVCASRMVLEHPEWVLSQRVSGRPVVIVTHRYPDMDAVGACWLAGRWLAGQEVGERERWLADYICEVDRGHTTLTRDRPLSAYALMAIRLAHEYASPGEAEQRSREGLRRGTALLQAFRAGVTGPDDLKDPGWLSRLPGVEEDIKAVHLDRERYEDDIRRAKTFRCHVPLRAGGGRESAPGLWIAQPTSALFKAWARGDAGNSGGNGFVFLAVELSPTRTIISVPPDSGLSLQELGARLEAAEVAERERFGQQRRGSPRPGFDGPDPWYDGRGGLHDYTIIDAPAAGTVLPRERVLECIQRFCGS